jgi:hypothetical protein
MAGSILRSPTLRAALALLLFSGWLTLLFSGVALGGAVHLLLACAFAAFPWKALPGPTYAPEPASDTEPRQAPAGTEGV